MLPCVFGWPQGIILVAQRGICLMEIPGAGANSRLPIHFTESYYMQHSELRSSRLVFESDLERPSMMSSFNFQPFVIQFMCVHPNHSQSHRDACPGTHTHTLTVKWSGWSSASQTTIYQVTTISMVQNMEKIHFCFCVSTFHNHAISWQSSLIIHCPARPMCSLHHLMAMRTDNVIYCNHN